MNTQTNDNKLRMIALMPLTLGFVLMACTMAMTPVIGVSQSSTVDLATAQQAAQNAAWGNNVTITINGTNMTIQSNGVPNHERADFYLIGGRALADPTATNNVSYTMPLQPEFTGNATSTGAGAIGVAVSGAVFFNPYEGDQVTYALEDNSVANGISFIDACNGHPEPNRGTYHYHGIPYCITDNLDTNGEHSVLIGYLRDGFAIYGPQGENGAEPTDLDQCNGHFGATPEFQSGTYHYHTTADRSYIPDCYMGDAPAGGGPGGPPGN
jgi:hypothetical protein